MRRNRCAFLLAAASTIGVLLPAAPSAAQTAPAPVIKNVPASIRSDGNAEVGAQLTRWLAEQQSDHAGQSLVVRFAPGGTYKINDASVVLNSPNKLTLDFQDATLLRDTVLKQSLRYPQRHGFLRLNQPTDVIVRDLNVQGVNNNDGSMADYRDGVDGNGKPYLLDNHHNGPFRREITDNDKKPANEWGIYNVALAFEHGVDITDGKNVVVENSDLRGMGGDGVGTTGDDTNNVTVRNNIVRRNGRQGVSITAGQEFLIANNDIVSRRAGVDIEPDTEDQVLRDIEIRHNTIKSHLLAFASGGPGEIHDVNIHHNTINESGVPVLFVQSNGAKQPRSGYKFDNNIVTQQMDSPLPLIQFGNVREGQVVGNTINRVASSCSHTAIGFTVRKSEAFAITGNTFGRAEPVVQDVAGGSTWMAWDNAAGPAPAPGLRKDNVLTHQMQDFESVPGTCRWQAASDNESTLARTTVDAHTGVAAMEVKVKSGLTGYAFPGARADIETGPDRSVSFKGAVKGLSSPAPVYVIFQPYGRNADNKLVPIGDPLSPRVTGSAAVGSWSEFSTTSVRTPAGTEKVSVAVGVVSNRAGHRYLFDHLAAFSKP